MLLVINTAHGRAADAASLRWGQAEEVAGSEEDQFAGLDQGHTTVGQAIDQGHTPVSPELDRGQSGA